MYITNRPEIAAIACDAGVDRIFVDLETIGKQDRQGGMDTVQSNHTIADIARLRKVVAPGRLFVRSNPVHPGTADEINAIIEAGADVVMLPFFKSRDEVETFIKAVGGRARTCLLVETPQAAENIEDILSVAGIDEVFIGLNDLHLGYGMKFMFQLLTDGTVERLASHFKAHGLPWGFGGIARVGSGPLPAERILREHYRLGSECVILSRSFCNTTAGCGDLDEVSRVFSEGVAGLRGLERECQNADSEYFESNRRVVEDTVRKIVER